ncbi:hypothetical protein FOQG_04772 [Fusarium oxysporum f. sp. raphani 54005]|uniref:Uncharacterized protein n=2 Tax=Fusarium oxysporum TaxID=5507 RepID=X0CH23_FUSOX|nr:hypothetical protein FOVG_01987 [Fusarium oxysporum f. sp. pisi HDV247]EXK93496.1 hypothetical protein FOQG_04772 [Fusarium oxysporum f. sp. raphani 54005]
MAGPTPWDDGEDVLGLICWLVKLREKVFVRVGLGGFSRASLARRREVGEIDRSGGVIKQLRCASAATKVMDGPNSRSKLVGRLRGLFSFNLRDAGGEALDVSHGCQNRFGFLA